MTGRRSWHRRLGQRSLLPATPGKTAVRFWMPASTIPWRETRPLHPHALLAGPQVFTWTPCRFQSSVSRRPTVQSDDSRISLSSKLAVGFTPQSFIKYVSVELRVSQWEFEPSRTKDCGHLFYHVGSLFSLFLPFFPWILIGFLPHFFPPPSLFLTSGLFKMGLEFTTDPAWPSSWWSTTPSIERAGFAGTPPYPPLSLLKQESLEFSN